MSNTRALSRRNAINSMEAIGNQQKHLKESDTTKRTKTEDITIERTRSESDSFYIDTMIHPYNQPRTKITLFLLGLLLCVILGSIIFLKYMNYVETNKRTLHLFETNFGSNRNCMNVRVVASIEESCDYHLDDIATWYE